MKSAERSHSLSETDTFRAHTCKEDNQIVKFLFPALSDQPKGDLSKGLPDKDGDLCYQPRVVRRQSYLGVTQELAIDTDLWKSQTDQEILSE